MEQKTILITGATDGIGKLTATALARQGHRIILHGRNRTKAEAVQKELIGSTGNPNIDVLIADLLSMAAIKTAVEAFKLKYDRLDVLINNAGAIFGKERQLTTEGLEQTIALNLLAPILLMQLLRPLLENSPQGRIINLSSAMHKRGGKPDFQDFQLEKSYTGPRAYGLSKLYLIWSSRYFAEELAAKGLGRITVNVTHPGAVATNFGQESDNGFFVNLIFKVALWLMPKPEVGARTSIYLATSPEVSATTGKFYGNNSNLESPEEKYYSPANAKLVWDYCQQLLTPYL